MREILCFLKTMTHSLIIIFPLLIPLATAVSCLAAWNRRAVQRVISTVGAGLLLASAVMLLVTVRREGIQVMQLGNWPAPFGITIVADLFSAVMVVMAGLIGFAVAVYSLAATDIEHEAVGYHPLYHMLLLGCCGSFLTGDIFNLYVWFEVMLISSFVLLALGGRRNQMEGAMKYVTLNLISSAIFLAAVGMLYGVTGTLNMAHLAALIPGAPPSGLLTVIAILFFFSFGIKSALFPLFFWLPASYHTPAIEVSAVFSGLLTKVGVYALIRVFTLIFVHDISFTHTAILVVSGFTMVTGVLGAVVQNDVRRILSFHIISQVGYMIMGLGLFTPLAVAGSVFYIVHHIIVKTNLFLVSGLMRRIGWSYDLKLLGGLYREAPALAALFLVPALSLAGIPPLSGFWAKLTLIMASLEGADYMIAAVALVVGILTLFSMTKIWAGAFWAMPPEHHERKALPLPARERAVLTLPVLFLAVLTAAIGFFPATLLDLAMDAAAQLLDPSHYIAAVLGEYP